MEKDKVFKGDNGFYGIGGETWITYEPDFDTEAEAQAILDAHNSGAESYQEAVQMALEKALSENARLESELTDAVQRAQEAEYNLHLMTKQADAFHAENGRLREQLRKAHITTVARHYSGDMDCEGDGSGPGCENPVVWEIQAMDDGGSHYAYVCDAHLGDYQKWAAGDGRSPMVFEKK